uniref:Uncharacterized protein n=1 Tax=Arundo donax TaxID=35708 RepID=A0A0A9BKT6_ARUDO
MHTSTYLVRTHNWEYILCNKL